MSEQFTNNQFWSIIRTGKTLMLKNPMFLKLGHSSSPFMVSWKTCNLSCVATRIFSMRLLHAVAFSKKLSWFEPTNVITLKTQLHAVNARWKWLSHLSFKIFPWWNLLCYDSKDTDDVTKHEYIVCLYFDNLICTLDWSMISSPFPQAYSLSSTYSQHVSYLQPLVCEK